MYKMTTTFEGFDEQIKKLEGFDPAAIKAFVPAFSKMTTITESHVKPLIPVGVSGQHRRAVTSRVTTPRSHILVEGRVGSKIKGPSAVVLEVGRKAPGRMPPVSSLIRWVELKLRVPKSRAKGVAFVIARNIARRGFKTWPKGTRAFQKGFAAAKHSFPAILDKAVAVLLKALSVGGSN